MRFSRHSRSAVSFRITLLELRTARRAARAYAPRERRRSAPPAVHVPAPALMPEPLALLIADRYALLRTLGQGAFGRTLLARDTESGRDVAIKMLDTQRVDSIKGFELFEREAAVMRSVRHHGVPEIYDSLRAQWEDRPAAFLIMEYVEGKSLDTLIKERHHLDPAEASHLLLELLGVLDYLQVACRRSCIATSSPPTSSCAPMATQRWSTSGRCAARSRRRDWTVPRSWGPMATCPTSSTWRGDTGERPLCASRHLPALTEWYVASRLHEHGRTHRGPRDAPRGRRDNETLSRMLQPSPVAAIQSAREVRQALLATEGVRWRRRIGGDRQLPALSAIR